VGELQSALFEMAASVADTRRDLESKVQARTAEMRRLLDQAQHVVEEERRYLSRELHDHFNAELIAIRLEAQQLTILSQTPSPANLAEIQTRAGSITKFVNDLYTVARGIVRGLRPELLETLGLQSALEEIIKSYDEMHPTCTFEYEYDGDFSAVPEDLAISAYRIAQEALANIARHAMASRATVRLTTDNEHLSLTIHDNGVGFNPQATHTGVGLIGMRERVHALHGSLRIQTAPRSGTLIAMMFPLKPNRDDPGSGIGGNRIFLAD
jgi:two-component system sensor histidine kinase UhpB